MKKQIKRHKAGDFIMIVKVGNEDRPASSDDIKDIVKQIESVVEEYKKTGKQMPIIVSHHCIDVEYVKVPKGKNGEIRVVGIYPDLKTC